MVSSSKPPKGPRIIWTVTLRKKIDDYRTLTLRVEDLDDDEMNQINYYRLLSVRDEMLKQLKEIHPHMKAKVFRVFIEGRKEVAGMPGSHMRIGSCWSPVAISADDDDVAVQEKLENAEPVNKRHFWFILNNAGAPILREHIFKRADVSMAYFDAMPAAAQETSELCYSERLFLVGREKGDETFGWFSSREHAETYLQSYGDGAQVHRVDRCPLLIEQVDANTEYGT